MGAVHAKAPEAPKPPEVEPLTTTPENEKTIEIVIDDNANNDYGVEDLEELFSNVQARVDKIHVDGIGRTAKDYIEDCFEDLFKAGNFEEIIVETERATKKLTELGCFKNIQVMMDTSKGPKSTEDGLDITFFVKETRRFTGGVSTNAGNNEGSVRVGVQCPNTFGRGELIRVEYNHSSKNNTQFTVGLVKPFKGSNKPIFTTSVFQNYSEFPASGFKERACGVLLDLGFRTSPYVTHSIQWEGNLRDLGVAGKSTSFEVREHSGITLKSALKHIYSMDVRDEKIFPSEGLYYQNVAEVAGLGGDIGFWKNESFLQSNVTLFKDIVMQGCFGFGVMQGLDKNMKMTLSDRFYIGGPLSLRGFQANGAGPHADGDAVGANAYWAAGLHLFTPLPFRPGKGGIGELFRTHFFINAGNIGDINLGGGALPAILAKDLRLSYGLGLALRIFNIGRIELNYCVPHLFHENDFLQPGVQFGIGVRFF